MLSPHGWTNIIVFLLRISINILRLRQCLTRRRINSPRTGGALHPTKLPFADKTRGRLDGRSLKEIRLVLHALACGRRHSSSLLSEYLALGCDENSTVPGDMMMAAIHCLDQGLRTVIDQFVTRRSNVPASGCPSSDGPRLICGQVSIINGG